MPQAPLFLARGICPCVLLLRSEVQDSTSSLLQFLGGEFVFRQLDVSITELRLSRTTIPSRQRPPCLLVVIHQMIKSRYPADYTVRNARPPSGSCMRFLAWLPLLFRRNLFFLRICCSGDPVRGAEVTVRKSLCYSYPTKHCASCGAAE